MIEATPEQSAKIAKASLEEAIACIDFKDYEHADMHVQSALIWLRGANAQSDAKQAEMSSVQWENDGGVPPRWI